MKLERHLPNFLPNHLTEYVQKFAALRTTGIAVTSCSMDEPDLPPRMHGVKPVQVDWHGRS
ncbi:MAG TPA: hypothetical protein VF844_13285 [Ktedonobacteraceae bacterium]